MGWDVVSKDTNSLLTSTEVNQLQLNFTAWAAANSGSPSFTNVHSFQTIYCESGFVSQVTSLGQLFVTSGFATDVGSFRTMDISSSFVSHGITSLGISNVSSGFNNGELLVTSGSVTAKNDVVIGNTFRTSASTAKIYEQRARFEWSSASQLYIDPFVYFHDGTIKQYVYSNSRITFNYGSAGSNSDSSSFGTATAEWRYLYLDDSAIETLGDNVLTASQLLDSTVRPFWNDSKQGWYPGSDSSNVETTDRCIGGFYKSGASTAVEFCHEDGSDLWMFTNQMSEFANTNFDSSFSGNTQTLTMPAFASKAYMNFVIERGDAAWTLYYRKTGASTSTGLPILEVKGSASEDKTATNVIIYTSSAQQIDLRENTSSTGGCWATIFGYFFPIGM